MAAEKSRITADPGESGVYFSQPQLRGKTSIDPSAGKFLASLIDMQESSPHYQSMESVSRPELDAKLEAIEARMDARVASIEGKIDAMLARMDGRDLAYEQRFVNFEQRFSGIEESLKDTRSAIGNLKSTTIVTAISAVLAIVLGVAAFNATVLSNMVAAFESGKNTSAAQAEVTQQARETRQMLDELRKAIPRETTQK